MLEGFDEDDSLLLDDADGSSASLSVRIRLYFWLCKEFVQEPPPNPSFYPCKPLKSLNAPNATLLLF